MSDEKNQNSQPDFTHINVNEDHQIRYWTEKIGASEKEIKEAVNNVGDAVADVEAYIKTEREHKKAE